MLTDRRSMSQEPLGAERERIHIHHAPATADIVSINGLDDRHFVHQDLDGLPAILVTYLHGSSYATRQRCATRRKQPNQLVQGSNRAQIAVDLRRHPHDTGLGRHAAPYLP